MEEVKKAGPKPKANQEEFEALQAKVKGLELVIAKMAHNSGIPNNILIDAGIEPYQLKPKDMKKYA